MYRSLLDYPDGAAPAGWYPSVKVPGAWRWWDGVSFTQDYCWNPDSSSWTPVGRRRNDRRSALGSLVVGFVALLAVEVLVPRPEPDEPSLIVSFLTYLAVLGLGWGVVSLVMSLFRARRKRLAFASMRAGVPPVTPTGEPWPPPSS